MQDRAASATPKRRLYADRAARWAITGGGVAVVLGILGILFFLLVEVVPLFGGAEVTPTSTIALEGPPTGSVVTDEYLSHAVTVDVTGSVRAVRLDDGSVVWEEPLLEGLEGPLDPEPVPGSSWIAGSTADGRIATAPVSFDISFEGSTRIVQPILGDRVIFEMDSEGRPLRAWSARVDEDGSGAAAAVLEDGRLVILRLEVEENLFTGERSESWSRGELVVEGTPQRLLLDGARRNLYATDGDDLLWWSLDGVESKAFQAVAGNGSATTLSFLLGDRTVVVGREDGSIGLWFPVRTEDGWVLTRIRGFESTSPAARIAPSRRDKGFLALEFSGKAALYYSTSHRRLWRGDAPIDDATALVYGPKADGAVFVGPAGVARLEIDNPHPEIGWRTLFAKVWYEGYERPEYIWQSTGGSDEFEPKISLMPLIAGTLKGTIYSLILAIPLGVLGAMYASQFMNPGLRRIVKPTVEIMAALPSVVLGFLGGLWLAPRLDSMFPAMVLMLALLPISVLAAGLAWRAIPLVLRGRVPAGGEILLYAVILILTGWLCLQLNGPFEDFLFGGDFPTWLLDTTGWTYDQRNAIVVGIAMGFAVIPIIFSISEDAFSNVPRNLISGSLALGANRWQTVTRVVLPTASPGIFTAIMVGFGRAIGETMIVLMATGNTPIMDPSPFNGFRTLSANIAVEIPEAPHGGTLYRTLFLAALLLFALTFALNTIAEAIRQRLRERYAKL